MRSPLWAGDRQLTQPWGPSALKEEPLYETPLGAVHWHCGVDVGMPVGTALYAARAGVVTRTGYGLLGVYSGPEMHFYVHIDRATVGMGSAVATGQLIAYSGSKVPQGGYLTGPHLHFERTRSSLNLPPGLDPMPLVTGLASAGSGSTVADVTPEEHDALMQIRGSTAIRNPATTDAIRQIATEAVAPVLAKVEAGLPAGATDPWVIRDALATVLEAVGAVAKDVAAIKARVEKDLAP